jgi:uncharacterized protein (TIGR03437 family)
MTLRKILAIAIAVAAICCFAVSDKLVAATVPNTAPMITYTASGTFVAPPTSGADTLKLAGEAFSVTISASAATVPYKHGPNWAAYNQLKLTGTVHSGLLGATPVNIASNEASIIQALDPGLYDQFTMEAPVRVVGISLVIKAVVIMPWGTIPKMLLHPFNAAVAMTPSNATVTYSANGSDTVLAVAKGTLTGTIPGGGAAAAAVMLHSAGAQAVTLHGDGSASVRSIVAAPVDLGVSPDAVTLTFYASGVRDASEVHVQIAGEEVPVLYAGASGYFPGLDEVMVQVPRSLAGRGATNVTLTADGQTADPVQIHIQ